MTLEEENKKLKDMLRAILAKDGPFICGISQNKDEQGLPDYVEICPAHGAEGSAVYKKVSNYSAPQW